MRELSPHVVRQRDQRRSHRINKRRRIEAVRNTRKRNPSANGAAQASLGRSPRSTDDRPGFEG
jgi:hypothetical protein